MAGDDGKRPENGVLSGSPASLFENFSAGEAALIDDAAPFRSRPTPVGGSRKGIPNKRSNQMRELYLKSGFPHPLLWQGSMLRLGVDGLAVALGCDLIEAAELLRKVASDALPYIEGKMPTKVQVEGGAGLPVLVFGDAVAAIGAVRAAREEGAMAIDDEIEGAMVLHEEKQRLREGGVVRPEGCPSHEEGKALNDKD